MQWIHVSSAPLMYNYKCVRQTCFLLGQDDESDELFGTDVGEAMVSDLLPEVDHEVKNSLTSQDFMADVRAQHYGRLILENVGGKAWPDSQPEGLTRKQRRRYNQTRYSCCSTVTHIIYLQSVQIYVKPVLLNLYSV